MILCRNICISGCFPCGEEKKLSTDFSLLLMCVLIYFCKFRYFFALLFFKEYYFFVRVYIISETNQFVVKFYHQNVLKSLWIYSLEILKKFFSLILVLFWAILPLYHPSMSLTLKFHLHHPIYIHYSTIISFLFLKRLAASFSLPCPAPHGLLICA